MTIQDFIEQVGHERLAETLDVTVAAISSWKMGKACPRPTTAFELIQLSHGALTWDDIYLPYVKRELKGKTLIMKSANGSQLEFKF